jgi:putative ABC transport system permease protein
MILHYLKITLRGLFKDRTFSLINIVGLAIAIACCFLLIFWVKFELSYESCYTNENRIYKLIEEEKLKDGNHYQPYLPDISKELKNTFPQIEASTYLYCEMASLASSEEGDGIMMNIAGANEDFLRIFDYEYLQGSPQEVVRGNTAIITEEAAYKYWGNESPIGKQLYRAGRISHTVGAVVKMPANTQVRFDILQLNFPFGNSGPHYLMLKDKDSMTPNLKEQISSFMTKIKETKNTLMVQPLKDVHLHSPKEVTLKERFGVPEIYGNYTQVLFFSAAVLLILFMAIINYVNTSIARAMNRMKEVGVRKVTGANRIRLIERFLFESFIITSIAVIISIVFTKSVFPDFSEIMGNKINLSFDIQTILITLIVCVVISALSGGYAAFYLSSFKPALILKGGTKSGTKDNLRKGLLGVQFFISMAVLISTVFIYKQINAIFNEETGMNRKNIIVLNTNLWYQSEDFIKIIKKENPNILDASMANCPPYNAPWSYTGVTWEGKSADLNEISFTQIFCDHNYASTFALELVQGEFIPPGLSWWQDAEEKSFNIVVNESFAKLMKVDNPIGVSVKYGHGTGKIIGIVKDFNFKPLKEKTAPLFMSFNPESTTYLYVKTTGKDKQATLDYLLAKYKEMKPDWARQPIMYHTVEDDYNKMYADELRTLSILSVFSVISFFLSLMGVFSMVSFMIEKRRKEIAIRKINGAGITDIAKLFCEDIVKTGSISAIAAIPLCYILLQNWLEGYVYRTALSWWIFPLIPAALLTIICFIISIQVWFSARRRPVESLRSE